MPTAPKPVQSEGIKSEDRAWLAALGVPDGEFLFETKARLRRIQRSPRWDYKPRVFANLALHTLGFRQQKAVKQIQINKIPTIVPLTPKDIADETGIDKNHVRRTLRELHREGFCETKGLQKGHVEIYAWAIPREPAEADLGASTGPQIPDGMPPEVFHRLRNAGVKLPEDFEVVNGCLPTILGALNGYQNAILGARKDLQNAILEAVSGNVYKDEIKEEKDISIGEGSSSSSALCPLVETAEEEESPPEEKISPKPAEGIKEVREAYPEGHWDDAKATESYRQTIKSAAEHKKLLEGLSRHKQSERWRDNAGYWIPLASNFISKRLYNYDPPPKLTTGKARAAPYTIFDMIREGGTS